MLFLLIQQWARSTTRNGSRQAQLINHHRQYNCIESYKQFKQLNITVQLIRLYINSIAHRRRHSNIILSKIRSRPAGIEPATNHQEQLEGAHAP
nr:MAG TPA: hypothetical protein [Bacteriophage sp.]